MSGSPGIEEISDCSLPSDVESEIESDDIAELPPDVGSPEEELVESGTGGEAEATNKFPCSCNQCAKHFSATQVEQWRAERMALPNVERKRSNIMM